MRRGRTALLAIPLLLCFLAPGVGAQDHRLGAVIDAQLDARVPYKSSLVRGLYTLPPRASVKQYAPYAGDQGDHGTCTAWSSAYAATTIIYAKLNGITDRQKITQLAFSPGFAFRESFGSQFPGCAGGQAIPNVLRAIQDNGVPLLTELDSLCPATLPRQAVDDARPYSILGFTRLLVPGDTASGALQKIKKSLSEGKPVVVGMYVDWVDGQGCFHNAPPDYVWKPVRTVTPQAGHAMTIVSYDDAYAGGAFELENSWGRDWGNDGFFWIRYNDFVDYVHEAFELIENPQMANIQSQQLSGALTLELAGGHRPAVHWNGGSYAVGENLPSGTRFRLYLDNNEPAFVYVIGVDSEWKTYRLFPSDPSMSPALTYARNRVALPGEDLFIQTDQNPGQERIVVLYSPRELDQAAVERDIEKGTGELPERIRTAVGGALVPFDHVSYTPNAMSFTAKGRPNDVVALLVSFNHTP